MTQAGEKPFAEEAGATGKKEIFAAQRFQIRLRAVQNMGQIGERKGKEMVLRFAHGDEAWLILLRDCARSGGGNQ